MKPSPLLALAPLLLISPAFCLSDWYVDSGASGCGSATGTQAAPYCSIAEAVSAAQDGDTIFVAAGTYSESVLVDVDVHFVGEDGAAPSIVDASGQPSALIVDSTATVTAQRLTMTGASGRGVVVRGELTLEDCEVTEHGAGGIGVVGSGASLELIDCLVADNDIGDMGAGIYVSEMSNGASLLRTTVTRNDSGFEGGGIFALADLTLVDSTVSENTAANSGGGVMAFIGTLRIESCSITDNTVPAFGGGIYGRSLAVFSLVNSTVSGNASTGPGFGATGGGMYIDSNGTDEINGCTITNNSADQAGGCLIVLSASFDLRNSIVAGNTTISGNADVFANPALTTNGSNVLGELLGLTPAAGDVVALDPMLAPLAWNGGLTQTHAPMLGSPALGLGITATLPPLDQRGTLRGLSPTEAGAFELVSAPVTCVGQANSTLAVGSLEAAGDARASENSFFLHASSIPAGAFGFFLVGDAPDSTFPAGTQGELCLGGNIGRLDRPGLGEVQRAPTEGRISLFIDLTQLPTGSGTEVVTAGTTRYFQLWYRDANPTSTSNFSSMVEMTFQ